MTDRDDRERATWIAAFAIALAVAFYTGFRMPNLWTTTLDHVSLTDGFYRRWLVGTLLAPFPASYWVGAIFSFAVLAAVLAVLARSVVQSQPFARRVLAIAWLLLPTGGFLFHEVGYFEQLEYLLLFASIALLRRGRPITATCLIALTPVIHEIALVTVIPIFGLVALEVLPRRRAVLVTAIPAALDLIVLVLPAASDGATTTLKQSLTAAHVLFRPDALALFEGAYAYKNLDDVTMFVVPIAILAVVAFAACWLADRGRTQLATLALSCLAIAAPVALIWAGSDFNRWGLLVLANFFVVLWLSLARDREPRAPAILVLVTTALVLAHVALPYFDGASPRELQFPAVRAFVRHLGDTLAVPRS